MSDEEKKAIERCKQLAKVEHANWIGISNQLTINTVLNLIENQQKEINLLKDQKEYVINEYGRTIGKKDKIINEMTKKINEAYFDENTFAIWFEHYICLVQEKEDYSYLEPIVIEYFTKKVEESENEGRR